MKKLITLIIILFWGMSYAQKINTDSVVIAPKNANLKIMPFISYNRNLDMMFGLIPMLTYKLNKEDKVSPKSISGFAGVYTLNDSRFITFFNRFFLAEDTWRLTLYAFIGDYNSQFFTSNEDASGFYDFGTEATILSFGFQRKVLDNIFVGLNYKYSNFYTEFEDNVNPPTKTETNGLELVSLYDTRNSVYYPNRGIKAKLNWVSQPEWFGNDEKATKIKSEYNQYFASRSDHDVIAARATGIFGLGSIPFEQQQTIGGKDIRGYSEGKYRGDGLLAIQGEYRWNFNETMGLVGFAGAATIYGSDTESFNWGLYPGAGIGYRYLVFKDMHFNIGLDAAVGKDDWGIYFRIGEAF